MHRFCFDEQALDRRGTAAKRFAEHEAWPYGVLPRIMNCDWWVNVMGLKSLERLAHRRSPKVAKPSAIDDLPAEWREGLEQETPTDGSAEPWRILILALLRGQKIQLPSR